MLENSEVGDSTDNLLQSPSLGLSLVTPTSPPDQASIQSSMDKNKETLKRKLMLRRSVTELVDQGIYPSLKTPPAFADKTRQLERAKTGDLLRHKIQQRPNRQLLVQQHILEDTNIDPSLHERQRLLKRSRLLDDLNDKLSHRPGPLELVQGNILQPPLELVNAIRDGTVQFLPTGGTEEMDQSSSSFTFDDRCVGSGGIHCPSFDESADLYVVSSPSTTLHADCLPISSTLNDSIPLPVPGSTCPQIPFIISPISPPGPTPEVVSNYSGTSNLAVISIDNNNNNNSNNNNNGSKHRIKKPKPKAIPKSRIIKFHEYKGPPSVVKNQPSSAATSTISSSDGDTPYHVLLQQQQLFLQLQLEFQQSQQQQNSALIPGAPTEQNSTSPGMQSVTVTSPPMTQPSFPGNAALVQTISLHEPHIYNATMATQAIVGQITGSPVTTAQTPAAQILNAQTIPTTQAPLLLSQTRPTQSASRQSAKALTSIPTSALSLPKLTGNLEEMKVADLKAELKKRCLPVSGSKPQLIERLKPFTDSSSNIPSPLSASPKSGSRPSSRLSAPLQFSQASPAITQGNDYANSVFITQPNTSTTACLVNSSSPNISSQLTHSYSMPAMIPLGTKDGRTVVSVKPLIKDELSTTTAISSPVSPQTLMTTNSGTLYTISPMHKVSSASKLTKPAMTSSKNSLRFADATKNTLFHNDDQNAISDVSTQALVSVVRETPVKPAEMMTMEVDSVSLPLFHQSVGSIPADNNPASMDTNVMGENAEKSINMEIGFDDNVVIKQSNLNPNICPATSRIINLGSSADSSFRIPSMNQNTEPLGLKTTGADVASHLETVDVSDPHQSSTHMPQIHLATPHDHTVTSPASLLQLQQLQQLHILQQLQQQLMQQTQAQQKQFLHQMFQQPSPSAIVQLTDSDQMVLAQAQHIEELQRQLQESHHRLELQQQPQQQQPQWQQLMQVLVPSYFAQNSLQSKLSQNQQMITPLVGHAEQQQQPSLVMQQQQPSLGMQQQQQQESLSVNFNDSTLQQTASVLSGPSTSQSQLSGNQTLVFTAAAPTEATSDYNSGVVSRTTSVPSSPLVTNQQKLNIHRCSSAPYINGQLKEPPYYHEAMRMKQQQQQTGNMKNNTSSLSSPTSCSNLEQIVPGCKSQAMDDVLEILIRNGELTLNAATEAFPTPRQTHVTTLPLTSVDPAFISSTSSLPGSPSIPVSVTAQNHTDSFPSPVPSIISCMRSPQHNQPSTSSASSSDRTFTSDHTDIFNKALLNDTQFSSSKTPDAAGPSSPFMNEDTNFGEFLDWGEMIPSSDLTAMDFAVEFGFDQLYLGDTDRSLDANICHDNQFSQEQIKSKLEVSPGLNPAHLTGVQHSHNDNSNATNMYAHGMHGSEPHPRLALHGHGNETVTPSNQMDTSEWLGAVLPSSSIIHTNTGSINAPANVSFTTDSYLTGHFNDPSFSHSPMGWEQLTNQGTSS